MKKWDELTQEEKAAYIGTAVNNGIYNLRDIRDAYESFAENDEQKPVYNPLQEPEVNIQPKQPEKPVNSMLPWFSVYGQPEQKGNEEVNLEADEEANIFRRGGWMPSNKIRKKISEFEGASMQTNRPFEMEAQSFVGALPEDIRDQVLQNQQLADSLYSYSYNVGAGNFRKRVVPALQKYYAGKGSVDDIASSMWASGDKNSRGLRRRREWERSMMRSSLNGA